MHGVRPSAGVALRVSNANVPVRIGDPVTGCAGNRFAGQVVLNDNLAVTFGANIVSHNPTIDAAAQDTHWSAPTTGSAPWAAGNNLAPSNAQ